MPGEALKPLHDKPGRAVELSPNEPPLIYFTVSYDEALTFASDYGRAAPAGVYEVETRGTVFTTCVSYVRTRKSCEGTPMAGVAGSPRRVGVLVRG